MTYPKTASVTPRYQYKGFWIEIFIDADFENHRLLFYVSVELPGDKDCINSNPYESREEAEFAAEEMIDSWN